MNTLEVALDLLEGINSRFEISPQDYITVCTPLKQLVCIFVFALWLLYLFNLYELHFYPSQVIQF